MGVCRELCDAFFLKDLFVFFLPALGLHGCSRALSSCGGWGLLMVVAPLAQSTGLRAWWLQLAGLAALRRVGCPWRRG